MNPATLNPLQETVLVALRRIIRATDLHSRRLEKDTGLTTPQLVVLRAVASFSEPSVTELARAVNLSQATVTTVLNKLDINGLVDRHKSERDKRRVIVRLTAAGRRTVKTAPQPLQDAFVARFHRLATWEQHQIVATLDRVAAMMDAESLDAAPLLAPGELARADSPEPSG